MSASSRTKAALKRASRQAERPGSIRNRRPRHRHAIRMNGQLADENELLRRYAETRDPRLKEELVKRFLPLARSLALRYRGASEQLEDLIQVASLGLVKALDGFDLERGRSFIAYAAPTILGELRRHFRDRVWELRLPARPPGADDGRPGSGAEARRGARPDPDGWPDRRATGAHGGGGVRGSAGRGGPPDAVPRRAPQPRGRGVGADGRDGGRSRDGLRPGRGPDRGRGCAARPSASAPCFGFASRRT